jgi:hypothetical protein
MDERTPAAEQPLLGLWLDGAFYLVTAESSRKGRNLAGTEEGVGPAGSFNPTRWRF